MRSCAVPFLLFAGIVGAYASEVERIQKPETAFERLVPLTSFEELEASTIPERLKPSSELDTTFEGLEAPAISERLQHTSELDTTFEGLEAVAASKVIQTKANFFPSAHQLHNGPPKRLLDVPARRMWGWSPPAPKAAVGYCGEMSVQTVGLYYGNYISQDAARGTKGGHDKDHSLLLAGHHEKDSHPSSASHALKVLNFNYSIWDDYHPQPQHNAFIEWARGAIDVGEPVIFGVFMTTKPDKDYDHIVPMVGHDKHSIYFNDLHGSSTIRVDIPEFVKSRKECSSVGIAFPHDKFRYCLPASVNYGIRVRGNADHDGVLLPVRLHLTTWEEPDYSLEDKLHAKPVELQGTVTVNHMKPGARYALLRYDNALIVPHRNFLKSNYHARHDFTAPSQGKAEFKTKFMSDSTVFFRCVRIP